MTGSEPGLPVTRRHQRFSRRRRSLAASRSPLSLSGVDLEIGEAVALAKVGSSRLPGEARERLAAESILAARGGRPPPPSGELRQTRRERDEGRQDQTGEDKQETRREPCRRELAEPAWGSRMGAARLAGISGSISSPLCALHRHGYESRRTRSRTTSSAKGPRGTGGLERCSQIPKSLLWVPVSSRPGSKGSTSPRRR